MRCRRWTTGALGPRPGAGARRPGGGVLRHGRGRLPARTRPARLVAGDRRDVRPSPRSSSCTSRCAAGADGLADRDPAGPRAVCADPGRAAARAGGRLAAGRSSCSAGSPAQDRVQHRLCRRGTAVALAVFRPCSARRPSGPRGWAACYAATAAPSVLDALAVTLAIAARRASVRREALRETAASAVMSAARRRRWRFAVDDVSAHPATPCCSCCRRRCCSSAYRPYAGLSRRHLGLERLYRFSQVLSSSPEVDEILLQRPLGGQGAAAGRRRGGDASWHRAPGAPAPGRPGRRHGRMTRSDAAGRRRLAGRAGLDAGPRRCCPRTRGPEQRAFLARGAWRDAVVVPLRGDAGVVGALLVADRIGDVGTLRRGRRPAARDRGQPRQHGAAERPAGRPAAPRRAARRAHRAAQPRQLQRDLLDGARARRGRRAGRRRGDDPRPRRLQGRQRHASGTRTGDRLLQEVAAPARAPRSATPAWSPGSAATSSRSCCRGTRREAALARRPPAAAALRAAGRPRRCAVEVGA